MSVWRIRTPSTLRAALFLIGLSVTLNTAQSAETRTPYQKYVNIDCPVSVDCILNIASVSEGRLEITNVSCIIQTGDTTAGAKLHTAQIQVMNGSTFVSGLSLAPVEVRKDTIGMWAANHAVFIFAKAGQRVRANVHGIAITFVACHISGTLVKII